MEFRRYAIYYAPGPGRFADAAAAWLGWDAVAGCPVRQPDLPVPLRDWTAEPRRYGFHGTLKPPLRLAEDRSVDDLGFAVAALASRLAPVSLPRLDLTILSGFLALVPGQSDPLTALAAEVVMALDGFRAPLTETEVARRRPDRLTGRQRELLGLYGYPYVMEEFRFHLTLSGSLSDADLRTLRPLAEAHFAPHLPRPLVISELCLFGETAAGFHLLHRYPLTG